MLVQRDEEIEDVKEKASNTCTCSGAISGLGIDEKMINIPSPARQLWRQTLSFISFIMKQEFPKMESLMGFLMIFMIIKTALPDSTVFFDV